MNYNEFMQSTIECKKCKWVGLGSRMVMGESFGDGSPTSTAPCATRGGATSGITCRTSSSR